MSPVWRISFHISGTAEFIATFFILGGTRWRGKKGVAGRAGGGRQRRGLVGREGGGGERMGVAGSEGVAGREGDLW